MRGIARAAAALTLAAFLTGCGAPADISGDYEAVAGNGALPSHLLLQADGSALADGQEGSWKANSRGELLLTLGDRRTGYAWEKEGDRLTVRIGSAQRVYIDSAAFLSDESAAAIAGRWADDLGLMLLRLETDGSGELILTDADERTPLVWQARDGILRLEYHEDDSVSFEYLSYAVADGCLRTCEYGGDPQGAEAVVMSGPDAQAAPLGEYRLMAVSTPKTDMPRVLSLEAGGSVRLDGTEGTWTHYRNGVTVIQTNGAAIPMLLIADGETLLMVETNSDSSVLWAREDAFSPGPEHLRALAGRWRGGAENRVDLAVDGSIDISWDGWEFRGIASVSGGLIRAESGDTVEYIRYAAEEGGVRMARGVLAFEGSEAWPIFTRLTGDE